MCISLGKSVSFLSSFGRIFSFLCGRILFCFLYFFGSIYRRVISGFYTLQFIKLRVNFSLVFEITFKLIDYSMAFIKDLSIGPPSPIVASFYTKVLASL